MTLLLVLPNLGHPILMVPGLGTVHTLLAIHAGLAVILFGVLPPDTMR